MILVRLGLWRLPFPTLLRFAAFLGRARRTNHPGAATPDDIVWAVNAASRFTPKATCLTRALTLNALLSRRGLASHIKIGIAKESNGGLKSHAWVEHDGRVILGALPDLNEYSTFVSLERATNLLDRGLSQ